MRGDAVIVGVGATEFSKESGRSELQLTLEAIRDALADAGVAPSEVDGLTTFTLDTSGEADVARNLGLGSLQFFAQSPYGGGGGCGTVFHAAMAVEAGVAEVVVCYRGLNERSGLRYGAPASMQGGQGSGAGNLGVVHPFGLITPATALSLLIRRYMHETGATSEDFGRVAVTQRAYAATNPAAWFHGKPITLADHQASRLIADPLRLLDCCQESDGAVAVVVTTAARAATLAQPPVVVRAGAQSIPAGHQAMYGYNHERLSWLRETELLGAQLWQRSGLGPDDMDLAILYDHFSPFVLMQLEALGLCGFGEAPAFVAAGGMGPGGRLPVNTNGGQLGEGYIHGMNGIAEAVRQLRGTAVNQVADARHAVVTSGPGVPTSGLVLARP